jgi:hypothetical protein
VGTVLTTSSSIPNAYPNGRHEARFSNGVLFAFAATSGGGYECRYSADGGANWATPTAGVTVGSGGYGSCAIDPQDYIHAVKVESGGKIAYYRGTPDTNRTSYAWSAGLTINTTNGNGLVDIVVHPEGTGWKAHIVWGLAGQSGASSLVNYQRVNITSTGTISLDGSAVQISGTLATNVQTFPSIAVDTSKNLYTAWNTGATGTGNGIRFRKATYSAGAWSWGTTEPITETVFANSMGPCVVDSAGRVSVAFVRLSVLKALRRAAAGGWTDISPSPSVAADMAAMVVDPTDNLCVVYTTSSPDQVMLARYGTAWSTSLVEGATGATYPSITRDAPGGAVDFMVAAGGPTYTVKSYRITGSSISRRGFNAPILGRGRRGVFTP